LFEENQTSTRTRTLSFLLTFITRQALLNALLTIQTLLIVLVDINIVLI